MTDDTTKMLREVLRAAKKGDVAEVAVLGFSPQGQPFNISTNLRNPIMMMGLLEVTKAELAHRMMTLPAPPPAPDTSLPEVKPTPEPPAPETGATPGQMAEAAG